MRSSPILLAALVIATVASLSGCKGNTLEGRWKVSGEGLALPGDATLTFSGGKASLDIQGTVPRMTGKVAIHAAGPYKLDGDKLTIDLNDATFDLKDAPPQAQMFLNTPDAKAMLLKGAKTKFGSGTIKWDSSDQVLLTTPDGTATLTRVKS